MSLANEFKAFALKGNVIDLAIAVVIGTAFGKIVTALVNDLIMPLVAKVSPSSEWKLWEVAGFKLGDFLGSIVDFLIIALVLFIVVVKLMGALQKKPAEPTATTKSCPECLETIPLQAKKCRACSSPQPA
jgi:large conductance mechanosensitive channel